MLRKKLDKGFEQEEDEDFQQTGNKDKVAVLAIAYHNMGVEQEFLRSYPAAILSYKKAVNYAEKNLGPEDGITMNLRSVYENARNEVSIFLTLCLGELRPRFYTPEFDFGRFGGKSMKLFQYFGCAKSEKDFLSPVNFMGISSKLKAQAPFC